MTQGSIVDSWQTQGLKPGHNPRFLHAVTCCHTGKNDCGVAEEQLNPFFSPAVFPRDPQGPRDEQHSCRDTGKGRAAPRNANPDIGYKEKPACSAPLPQLGQSFPRDRDRPAGAGQDFQQNAPGPSLPRVPAALLTF